MNNSYYTMDDLKAETSAPPAAPASSIAYDEPRDSDDSAKIANDMLGSAKESDDERDARISTALADLITDMKTRGANGLIINNLLIARLPDGTDPLRVMQMMDRLSRPEEDEEDEGHDVLNVVDKLTEDVEAAVLQCATADLSAAVIERVLKIGEDSEDDVRVVFTASRRKAR